MTKRQDLFTFLRRTMYCGMIYSPNVEQQLPKKFKKMGFLLEIMMEIFLYLVVIHIVILYACTMYLNFDEGDLQFLVDCFMQLIIYSWTILMKLYFRRLQNYKLKDLFDFVNFNYKTRSDMGYSYVSMDETCAMADKWSKLFVYSCFTGVICWLLVPIAYSDRSLPLSCWYPFDYKKPIVYELIYCLQSLAQLQVAASFSSSTAFHMILSILISGQYDVLCSSLKNVFATAAINRKTSVINIRELSNIQQLKATKTNEYYCCIEVKPHGNASASSVLAKEKQHLRYHYRRNFKKCIQHHYFILKCLNKMEAFYNPIWLLKTGEVTLLMCLIAFAAVKITSADSFIKILSLVQYLFLVVVEFLLICYFGEIIFLKSQSCFNAILRSPWYRHMPEIRNDFLIFLQINKKPFQLTAGKIYDLNIECFKRIMTTAFSFLTFLQSIDERSE